MKVGIVSDGKSTRVINSITGENVENVLNVTFTHERGKPATATVDLVIPGLDIEQVAAHFTEHHPQHISKGDLD